MIQHVNKNKMNIMLGIILIVNLLLLINYRVTFGTVTLILFSILFVTIVLLCRIYLKNRSKNIKFVLTLFIMVLVIWIISFVYIESNILGTMVYSVDSDDDYDYLIILGAGLKGEEISFVLKQRLAITVNILHHLKSGRKNR